MYAILNDRGRQHKVSTGELVEMDRMTVEPGAVVTFDNVLLVGGEGGGVKVGSPNVAGATVVAKVVEHTKGEKTIAHHRVRTNSLGRRRGHRRQFTVVEITAIA